MLRKVAARGQTIIVYPPAASVFYEELARRLLAACEEIRGKAALRSSAEVRDMDEDQLADATLLIVNPLECSYRMVNRARFFSRLSVARKRVMVLAEAVGIRWFERQFELPLRYDALIDVGFSAQGDKLRDRGIRYRFLFNGADARERRTMERMGPSERRVPWAFVGHSREARARLAAELTEKLDPAGFVFLPSAGAVREGHGTIGPSGLKAVLSRTEYYVWNSHHESAYYESFRFREAVLAGAVPCKIDPDNDWGGSGIPGVFPSVGALGESIRGEGFAAMYESARGFYLSRGAFSEHLKGALEDV